MECDELRNSVAIEMWQVATTVPACRAEYVFVTVVCEAHLVVNFHA